MSLSPLWGGRARLRWASAWRPSGERPAWPCSRPLTPSPSALSPQCPSPAPGPGQSGFTQSICPSAWLSLPAGMSAEEAGAFSLRVHPSTMTHTEPVTVGKCPERREPSSHGTERRTRREPGKASSPPSPRRELLRTRQPTADGTDLHARKKPFTRAGRGLLPRGQPASLGPSHPVLPREGEPSRGKAPTLLDG